MSVSEYSEFDSNFFIPDISETPLTLEEILNQDEQQLGSVIDEEELSQLNTTEDEFDLGFLDESSNCNATTTSLNISPINHIKSQLSLSKNEKVNSGNPSSLTSSKSFIVIGTFYGHILVFDGSDKLKWFCKQEFEFGSIAALSITHDEQRLICGGSKGAVSLWNLANGEMLRMVENLHAPFTSIINLKYLSDSNFAILSDTSGSVFILDGRKKDFDSNCIFTGSRGEVLSIQPLMIEEGENAADFSGIESLCIVAMATVSKVIVISVRPTLFVHFTFLLKASPEFLPLLSWNFSFKHKNKNIPLLTFGRQDQLFIHKMETDFEDRINFVPLFQFKSSSYYLQNIFWIHSDTFLIVDTNENIHLIDFLAQTEIETIDIAHVELVYESSNYKSLVNGGYVSKAMAKAGEHACGNSFSLQRRAAPQADRLFILGLNCVYEASLRTWQERAQHLMTNGNSYAALQLIHSKYVTLKDRIETKEDALLMEEIADKLEETFNCFTSFLFEKGCLRCSNEFTLRKIISIILKYCVCLRSKYETVFELFEKFQPNELARCTFLESLEHFIFNNEFPDLNPILVKEIISYYAQKKWYNLLDSLVIHFSVTALDIDYIVKISLDYFLYDSFIYIHNVAFQDFITPFDRLLEVLHRLIEDKVQYSKEDILLGNKLLVYLNCMLTCAYYPNKGRLAPSDEFEHLERVYSRILSNGTTNPKANVMNVLFKYDCTEFLNVILIAFEYLDQRHSDLMKWKQTLTDFFLLKIVEDEMQQFNSEQQNAFFIFLARSLINSDAISINKKYFIKMIHSLFSKESKRFEERQQILIQILCEHKFKHFYEQSLFLESAEKSQMYKICEFIHRQNQDWTALFFIYTQDPSKEAEVFDYVHSLLSQNELLKTHKEKSRFLEVIFDNYLLLVRIDAQKAVNIFLAYFDQSEEIFDKLIEQLSSQPTVLFQFMKLTIFENRVNYSSLLSNSSESHHKIFDLCLNSRYQEQYIELCCQLDSGTILYALDVLQECNHVNALKICKQYDIKEGEAYIYEKTKQFKKSFDLLLEDFKQTVNEAIQYSFNNLSSPLSFAPVDSKFSRLLDFCKRSFKRHSIDEATKQGFCLSTLEYLIETKTTLNNIFKMKNDKMLPQFLHLLTELEKKPQKVERVIVHFNERFKMLFEKLINVMLMHLSLVDLFDFIVNKVLQHEDLYDVREMLLCILENYHYEKSLLELTNNMLSSEHHQLISRFQAANVRSKNVRQSYCGLCLRTTLGASNPKDSLVLYSCSHLFHKECVEDIKNSSQLLCPLCNGLITEGEPGDGGQAQEEKVANEDDDGLGAADEQPTERVLALSKLCLNETQYRALNYFHHGRLRNRKIK